LCYYCTIGICISLVWLEKYLWVKTTLLLERKLCFSIERHLTNNSSRESRRTRLFQTILSPSQVNENLVLCCYPAKKKSLGICTGVWRACTLREEMKDCQNDHSSQELSVADQLQERAFICFSLKHLQPSQAC